MKQNIGEADKAIRVIIGTVLVFWGLYNRNLLGLVGLYPLITAFAGYCPVCDAAGINTMEKKASASTTRTRATRKTATKTKTAAKRTTKKRRK